MSRTYFVGWTINRDQRQHLLDEVPPAYPDVIADHVTLVSRADQSAIKPAPVTADIVGKVDDGAGIQALVVEIDGTTNRPDGSTYHITWSLDRGRGRKPVESNEVIAKLGWTPLPRRRIQLDPVKRPG